MPPSLDSSRPIMAASVRSFPPPPRPSHLDRHHTTTPPLTRRPQVDSRTPKRLSTLSAAPSTTSSNLTGTTLASSAAHADPRVQDLSTLQRGLQRLEVTRLQQQRYEPSREKRDSIASLALGAKVERALGRRMTGQDAVLRVKAPRGARAVTVGAEKAG